MCVCVKLFPDPPPLSVTSRPSGVAGGTGRLQLLSCETLLWLSVRGGGGTSEVFVWGEEGSLLQEKTMKGL